MSDISLTTTEIFRLSQSVTIYIGMYSGNPVMYTQLAICNTHTRFIHEYHRVVTEYTGSILKIYAEVGNVVYDYDQTTRRFTKQSKI